VPRIRARSLSLTHSLTLSLSLSLSLSLARARSPQLQSPQLHFNRPFDSRLSLSSSAYSFTLRQAKAVLDVTQGIYQFLLTPFSFLSFLFYLLVLPFGFYTFYRDSLENFSFFSTRVAFQDMTNRYGSPDRLL
jgi:hypothetical protein